MVKVIWMRDRRFDAIWDSAAEDGECDSRNGAEYRRVRKVYDVLVKHGAKFDGASLRLFIIHEANKVE